MTLNITQEEFERLLPFMGTASEDVFNQFEDDLDVLTEELLQNFSIPGTKLHENLMRTFAVQWVVFEAVLQKLRSCDLILTDSGFGVVSTQNVAPASRERVDALEKELVWRRDLAQEKVVTLCRCDEWADTTAAMEYIPSLLWRPSDLKRYAATSLLDKRTGRVGHPTYYQLQACASSIQLVMQRFEHHFSVELAEELLFEERADKARSANRNKVVNLLRIMIGQSLEGLPSLADLTFHQIGAAIERHIEEFPEYRESEEYKVNHGDSYENTLHAKAFFF